ncbi:MULTISPECIES: peptidase domain-containing ABC transporter [unclassified Anabaena]|uniref:peptidase domain-containing ABC transporter n=1 Tax=unclassified Anabaena TaxID=2619674 RepID=UPI00082AF528|nr:MULTISPECIES: peptidase domain-containing ABC transporter [unclassified Anabaena]
MKYQWVKQHSGEDCAAASLAIVAQHYGRKLRINRIRELVGTNEGGTTMLGLKYGAQALGFAAQAIKASPEILDELDQFTLPAIIFWKGYHFVVLYGKKNNKYIISDPAMGICHLSRQELLADWQGQIMLLLEPEERFFATEDEEDVVNPLDSLLQRLWQQRQLLWKVIPLNLVIGLLALANPLLLQFLTDTILVEGDRQKLTAVALGVMGLIFANGFLSWLQSNLVLSFAERLQQGLKLEFAQQVLHLPVSYHEARRSGTAVRRLADIQQIQIVVSRLIIQLPIQIFIGLVAAAVIFYYSPKLALLTLAVGGVMAAFTLTFKPLVRQTTFRSFAVAGKNSGVLAEMFRGALTIKTTVAAPQLWQEIQQRFDHEYKLNLHTARIKVANNIISSLLAGIGTVSILWYGSYLVFQAELTIGQLLAIYGLKFSFWQLVTSLMQTVIEWTEIRAITQLLAELFEFEPENRHDSSKVPVKLKDDASIRCEELNFYYPGRIKLLENLSLTIPGGKVIALIGRSGCGKSTLAKLLTGLYPLQSGKIYIGDHCIQDLPLDCLRQQVIHIPQETFFLHRSIADNFRLGSPDATLDEIIAACKVSHAHEFVSKFPEKYDTVLGAVAANISGGQKQRLAIARAILNHPPVMILDESTSNLDPISEREVLENLLTHRQGKTTILISHRPKVIERADWIVLLEEGKLKYNCSRENFLKQATEDLDFINP